MNVLDTVSIKGLRRTHFEQLLSYIEHREEDMWYYGCKKQFEKRHLELKEWVEQIIEDLTDE